MEALDGEKLQGMEAGGDIDGGAEAAAFLADFDVSRGLPVGDWFAVEKNRPRDMRLVAAEADGLLFFDVPERLPREDGDAVGRFRRRLPSGVAFGNRAETVDGLGRKEIPAFCLMTRRI